MQDNVFCFVWKFELCKFQERIQVYFWGGGFFVLNGMFYIGGGSCGFVLFGWFGYLVVNMGQFFDGQFLILKVLNNLLCIELQFDVDLFVKF